MTYCIGMRLDAGMVFLSDSRTNAGVDHINTFRKMNVFQRPGDRVMVLMSSGNLAITQSLVSTLKEAMAASDERDSLWTVPNMFEAAIHVGNTLRALYQRDADALKNFGVDFNCGLILGGQIRGEEPRLFNIYAAGNFIEATRDTPYFQIGESKYGKPIIDRVLNFNTSLETAMQCALISIDSTLRSNLSVGLPLDALIYPKDSFSAAQQYRITEKHPHFLALRQAWGEGLQKIFSQLPPFDL